MFWIGPWWSRLSQDHSWQLDAFADGISSSCGPKKGCQKPPAFHSLSFEDFSGTCQQWPSEASKALRWVCRAWLCFQKMEWNQQGNEEESRTREGSMPNPRNGKAGLQLNLNSVPPWILDSQKLDWMCSWNPTTVIQNHSAIIAKAHVYICPSMPKLTKL